jgi:hypothetical protein
MFAQLVCFSQLFFYPHVASSYIQKLILKVYAEGYSFDRIAARLLEEEINMGCNTHVSILKTDDYYRKYMLASWSHHRPLAFEIPPQCADCFALQSYKFVKTGAFTFDVWCTSCSYRDTKTTPDHVYFPPPVIHHSAVGWALIVFDGSIQRGDTIEGYLNIVTEAQKQQSSGRKSRSKKKKSKGTDTPSVAQATEQLTRMDVDGGGDADAEGEPDDDVQVTAGKKPDESSQDRVTTDDADMVDAAAAEFDDSGSDEDWKGGSVEGSDSSDSSDLSMERPARKMRNA